ncbi:helix-turn-helix domain-containing protein [Pseudomonas citronellolis]|uniref:helix-turn-helix domain-containing protein n=1 Tax=Pseudomonas citronellolis TaxID=53408 RepID=UPI000E2F8FA7|nr:helix-turn-helix domain-containing protein [Pseudomonas citronellolis]
MASANHEKSTSHIGATSSHAQRARLLKRLQLGPVDTLTARSELNILMPAARIKELKNLGYDIRTYRITLTDQQGNTHHGIALYYLPTVVRMLAA